MRRKLDVNAEILNRRDRKNKAQMTALVESMSAEEKGRLLLEGPRFRAVPDE